MRGWGREVIGQTFRGELRYVSIVEDTLSQSEILNIFFFNYFWSAFKITCTVVKKVSQVNKHSLQMIYFTNTTSGTIHGAIIAKI